MKSFNLSYKNKEKIIKFTKDLEKLENLYKSIKEFTKLEKNQIKLSYIDMENEEETLIDIHDWEYFIGQSNENGSLLKIDEIPGLVKKEKISEIPKSEEEVEEVEEVEKVEEVEEVEKVEEVEELEEVIEKIIQKECKLDESEFLLIENSEISEMNNSRIEKDKEDLLEEFKKAGIVDNLEPIIRNSEAEKIFKTKKNKMKDSFIVREFKEISDDIQNSFIFAQKKSKKIIQDLLPKIIDKFDLQENIEKKNSNKIQICTSHLEKTCNICKICPIVGKRYKCTVCKKFNLCGKCEDSTVHKHPMLRFIEQENEKC